MPVGEHVKALFALPEELREEFLQDCVRKNRVTMQALCGLAVVVELFNCCRVLVFSRVGLSTLNNRIYLTFYVVLLALAVVVLVLHRALWRRPVGLNRVHLAAAAGMLLWNALLNTYDVTTGQAGGVTVLATALLGLSVLVQARPRYMLPAIALAYGLFLAAGRGHLHTGSVLNLTVAAVMSGMVSVAHFRFVTLGLTQKQQIRRINEELRQEQEKLRLSLEQHRILMDQTSDILFRWELEGDRVEFSHNWGELFGYPLVVEQFQRWMEDSRDVNSPLAGQIARWMEEYRRGKRAGEHEISLQMVSGEVRWYQLRVSMQQDLAGRPVQGIGVLRDISKQRSEIQRLQSRLQRDNLTGILNKQALEAYARQQLSRLGPDGAITMLMMDLDQFKAINDTYGHPCGDYVLMEMANGMREVFRDSDGLGRMGGDEFAAVLPGLRDRALIQSKAEQLRAHIRQIQWRGQRLNVGCSIGGVVLYGPAREDFETLYYRVDEALYQAKSGGRDRLHLL